MSTTKPSVTKSSSKKTSSSKATAPKNPESGGADSKHVVVRMYAVGFGDAFLLMIPNKSRPGHPLKILVDCGVHMSGPNPKHTIAEMARQIVQDVTEDDGVPRIHVVIATHRHQDHVSGFKNSTIWDGVEVQEVWMPWTEDPKDPEAKKIRETQSKTAKHLTAALEKKLASLRALKASKKAKDATLEAKEIAENSLTNAEAMQTLHEGFAGQPRRRFLPYKTRDRNSFKVPALPGVTVHVMGPSRDAKVIRDMNPPKGQSYLRLAEAAADVGEDRHLPFHPKCVLDANEYNADESILKKREINRINNIGDGSELAVAVALDQAVNGTSLMIMLQIGKAYLLLPGDAQWGTWNMAMSDPEWAGLLAKTSFYKIGHHGSHNATPVDFVENILSSEFTAMASVRSIAKWKFIPKNELMEALRKKSRKVVRSDKADPKDPQGFTRVEDLHVETKIPI